MASRHKKSPPSSPPPLAPFQLFLALRLPPSATRLFPRSPAVLSPSSSRPPRFSPGRRLPVRGRERKAAPLFSFSRLSLTSPDAASPPAFLPPAASARLLLLPLVPYSPARPAVLSPPCLAFPPAAAPSIPHIFSHHFPRLLLQLAEKKRRECLPVLEFSPFGARARRKGASCTDAPRVPVILIWRRVR